MSHLGQVGVLVSDGDADGETLVFVVGIVMGNGGNARYIEVRVGIVEDGHASEIGRAHV